MKTFEATIKTTPNPNVSDFFKIKIEATDTTDCYEKIVKKYHVYLWKGIKEKG